MVLNDAYSRIPPEGIATSIKMVRVRALILGGITWFITTVTYAQIGPTGGRDTSFTVQGSYQREEKHHPDITLADSTLPAGVHIARNINPWFTPTLTYITDFLRRVLPGN